MNKLHYTDVPAEDVEEGAEGVKIRWIITEDMGAPNFVMRHFEIAPGGHTPLHRHAWEHEVFILGGDGVVVSDQGEVPLNAGDVVFMPGEEQHQFRCTGSDPLALLCLIPSKDKCSL